tara:strand:- start:65 stop:337 length:273 start_codon:yes stop_codon:yes gene_type:complete
MDNYYLLPLWLQIYYGIEENIYIRSLLRMTCKSFKKNLFVKDFNDCYRIFVLSWYNINKNYELIADDSINGNIIYTYNFNRYESCVKYMN